MNKNLNNNEIRSNEDKKKEEDRKKLEEDNLKRAALQSNIIKYFELWFDGPTPHDKAIDLFLEAYNECFHSYYSSNNIRDSRTSREAYINLFKEERYYQYQIGDYDKLLKWFKNYSDLLHFK